MNALITGGAGAIGSNLAKTLCGLGWRVTVLDDLSSGHRHHVPSEALFVEGSICDDAALERAFSVGPSHVFHLAALFANQNSVDHPRRDLDVNGLGTLKIFEAASAAGVAKVLYASSSCVYGHKAVMREDDVDFGLDTPYAITKLLGEKYAGFFAEHHGLDVVIVRLFNTYGPHEYPGRYRNVIPNFFKLAMAGQPLPITGTGEETRDFNFVADTVEGLIAVMSAQTSKGDVFNIAGGRETKILELAGLINRIAGSTAGVDLLPRRGWDHVLSRRGDPSKLESLVGYRLATPLEVGLEKTYAWLRSVHV